MNLMALILTVCSVASPGTCKEVNLPLEWTGSSRQCVMAMPPYIAQWAGEHPQWSVTRWRCEAPHSRDRAGVPEGAEPRPS